MLRPAVSATGELGQIEGTGLTCPRVALTADLGAIDVAFLAPPTSVGATDQDGSVLIQVPATTSYAVTTTVSLGSQNVSVPVSGSSPHVIVATSELGSVTITG